MRLYQTRRAFMAAVGALGLIPQAAPGDGENGPTADDLDVLVYQPGDPEPFGWFGGSPPSGWIYESLEERRAVKEQANVPDDGEDEEDVEFHLVAPNGARIIGTLENITGRCDVLCWTRDEDGDLVPEFTGGTEIFWEGQETAERDGQMIVLDRDGNEYLAGDCGMIAATPDNEEG